MVQLVSVRSTLSWLSLLFLLGALVTAAAFLVFVPGPDRKMTFYVALSVVVAAEFVFFSHMAHSKLAQAGAPSATPATRFQVQGGIFVWLVLTILAAALAVHPDRADTIAADKILIIDLILTFLFFAFAYFMYSKDIEVQEVDRELSAQRQELRRFLPAIEDVKRAVKDLGNRYGEHGVLVDRILKKLETVCTEIEAILVSESGLSDESDGAGRKGWEEEIRKQVERLAVLSGSTSGATSDQAPGVLNQLAALAETLLTALRRRERSLLSH